MKLFVSLVLLLAVVGMALADVAPQRKLSRPLVLLPLLSFDQPGLVGRWARVILGFFAPPLVPLRDKYSAPSLVIPEPPLCTSVCLRIPIQSIAQ
jgi:hypothetical protein